MKKKTLFTIASTLLIAAIFTSCGSSESKMDATEELTEAPSEATEEVTATINAEEFYTSSGCVACHQVDTKTVGPSIKDIAAAYTDNKEGLIRFMKGEGEAIVDPAQAVLMQPQVEVTKAMSDDEREALADYVLSK